MIRVIEGKKYGRFVKDMATLMYINDEHKINFYINSNLENSISVENNNTIKITAKETEDTEYTIIYMLQKYRFLWVCNKENKDERVLNIINNYLANYYMMTLFVDSFENSEDLVLKDMLVGLKEQICNACKVNIINFNDESEKDDITNEINYTKIISEVISCRNVLRKYNKENNKYISESNVLGDILEKLEWHNVNEMYLEIEQAFYSYLE